ncbi:hypothetical protein BDV10DRAFT_174979 [Aspergillus recurvatus]
MERGRFEEALQRLLNDMQFRTPDIGSLNCLLVASRERASDGQQNGVCRVLTTSSMYTSN